VSQSVVPWDITAFQGELLDRSDSPITLNIVFARDGNVEHVIRCDCLRSATTVVGDELTATRTLGDIGWHRHEDGWRCPACSEAAQMNPSPPSGVQWAWSYEERSSGVHAAVC
jgi:hypothetical protein